MSQQHQPADLAAEIFQVLRTAFFSETGEPRTYQLRDKRNTQDDPFDEYVHRILTEQLHNGTVAVKALGPLITPDLVIMRPEICNGVSQALLLSDLTSIVGMEVKKLERTLLGRVARASGMDYNITPPCGTVRVYDQRGHAIDIRGFYLFVCQEPIRREPGLFRLSALVLCDGNLLNADFEFYLSIVGERTKGTDGANRVRPMLIFANPLGLSQLDHMVTLIHSRSDLENEVPQLTPVGRIQRTTPIGDIHSFYCYRLAYDIRAGDTYFTLLDPFPSPARTERTQARGRFRIDLRLSE